MCSSMSLVHLSVVGTARKREDLKILHEVRRGVKQSVYLSESFDISPLGAGGGGGGGGGGGCKHVGGGGGGGVCVCVCVCVCEGGGRV